MIPYLKVPISDGNVIGDNELDTNTFHLQDRSPTTFNTEKSPA